MEDNSECNGKQWFILFCVIIKFLYNARVDWLNRRALSEYRCTEQRCHAINPFVKFLHFFLGFIYLLLL